MRSRSGAIHSDSAQDFLLMAELSQSKTGIFYDQTTNKKIMNQVEKTQKSKVKQKRLKTKHSNSTENAVNVFENFNFNTVSEEIQDQTHQLNRKETNISKVVQLGIITSDLTLLKRKIQQQANLELDFLEQSRFIDLLTVPKQNLLFKIWIFDAYQFQQHKLAPTYFSNCHALFEEVAQNIILKSNKSQQIRDLIYHKLGFLIQ